MLRTGYGVADLRADLLAGIVVGVVALPLSMALAIASGVPPQHGLYTAIVAGCAIGLLGGSRYQVSGPTAAFVVVLSPIAAEFGLGGLLTSSGSPCWPGRSPRRVRRTSWWAASPLALLLFWPRVSKRIPAPLVALAVATALAAAATAFVPGFHVDTIQSRFSYEWAGSRHAGIPLTVAFDMVVSVTVGIVLAALLFMRRMAELSSVTLVGKGHTVLSPPLPPGVLLYDIGGPLFFGAAQKAMSSLGRIESGVRTVVLDVRDVPAMDATGLVNLEAAVARIQRSGILVILGGVQPQPLRVLERAGWRTEEGKPVLCESFDDAIALARLLVPTPPEPGDAGRGQAAR